MARQARLSVARLDSAKPGSARLADRREAFPRELPAPSNDAITSCDAATDRAGPRPPRACLYLLTDELVR